MNKELKKEFTPQDKIQKILLWVLLVSLLIGPLIVLQLDGLVRNMESYVFGLTVVVVVLLSLWLGSRMVLPMYVKPEDKPEGDQEEELFL